MSNGLCAVDGCGSCVGARGHAVLSARMGSLHGEPGLVGLDDLQIWAQEAGHSALGASLGLLQIAQEV